MIPKPDQPRRVYLRQIWLILAALCLAIPAAVYSIGYGGSLWWLLAADVILVLACGRSLMLLLDVWGAFIGSTDLFGVVFLAMTPFIVPVIAPVALIWNAVQARRAQP